MASLSKIPTHEDLSRVLADLREVPGLASDPLVHHCPPGGSHSAAGLGGGVQGAALGGPLEAPGTRQLLGSQSQDLEERKTQGSCHHSREE